MLWSANIEYNMPLFQCFRRPRDVRILDYHHMSLSSVPNDVFTHERTLEELLLDSNQIRDLAPELFHCHGLRKLSLRDNELQSIPAAVSSLVNLEEIDFSKNGIVELPDSIKCCKHLSTIQGSVNPLGKLPDGFTQLLALTHLHLNDTFLEYLPGSIGRLSRLRIFELRQNHLKTLPGSMCRMVELESLDIGENDMTELPDVVGQLPSLLELWCDSNQIVTIPSSIQNLKQLLYFDASKNNIEALPNEVGGCSSLSDIHLSINRLKYLPESIGQLSNLTTLKLDDNDLIALPFSIGGLVALSELNVSDNDLDELPASIGLLRNLRTLYADNNLINNIPNEIGSCTGMTVVSLRCNKLYSLPDEIGRLSRLRVMNVSGNCLVTLPYTIIKLKQLHALWLSDNQAQPLIPLQTEVDRLTGLRSLTCYLLPQQSLEQDERADGDGDTDPVNNSMSGYSWDEDRQRQIQFNCSQNEDQKSPKNEYPKEMKALERHNRNEAIHTAITSSIAGSPTRSKSPTNRSSPNATINRSSASINQNMYQPLEMSDMKLDDYGVVRQRVNPAEMFTNSYPSSPPPSYPTAAPAFRSSETPHRQPPDHRYMSPSVSGPNYMDASHSTPKYANDPRQQNMNPMFSRPYGHQQLPHYETPHREKRRVRSGYESEGYKSDSEGYRQSRRRNREYHDGYSSDWDASSRTPKNHDGYSSDWGASSSRAPRHHSTSRTFNSSEADMYTQRLRNCSYNSGGSLSNFPVSGAHRTPHRKPLDMANFNVQPIPRTTIRNDEMYDTSRTRTKDPAQRSSNTSASHKDYVDTRHMSADNRPNYTAELFVSVPNRSLENSSIMSDIEPQSQISNSTDSGYVHTQNERSSRINISHPDGSPFPDTVHVAHFDVPRKPRPSANGPINTSQSDQSFGTSTPVKAGSFTDTRSYNDAWTGPDSNSWKSEGRQIHVTIVKNPGLGFSITGGLHSSGNPYRPSDMGIFVTKVNENGPAVWKLRPGDKILELNGGSFTEISHAKAVKALKNCSETVSLLIDRI